MKNNQNLRPLWRQSSEICHASLLFVFLAFMVDSLNASFLMSWMGPSRLIILIPLKIYLFGGIYAALFLVTSGEEVVVSRILFQQLAKKYWFLYFIVSLLPILTRFLIDIVAPGRWEVSVAQLTLIFSFLQMYGLVYFFMRQRYRIPLSLPSKRIRISFHHLFQLIVLYIMYWIASSLFVWGQHRNPDASWIFLFAVHYLHFYSFIFICKIFIRSYPEVEQEVTKKKELYLILPPGGGVFTATMFLLVRLYPSVFSVLRALTPDSYRVTEFYRLLWHAHFYAAHKLVAITCTTHNCCEAYKIAKEFKRRGSTVIMGGPHVSCCPDEALTFCDSVVICQAEGVWEQVLADYERGCLQKIYVGHSSDTANRKIHQVLLKSPAWKLKDSIETTRGCKFNCSFCTDPFLNKEGVQQKPIDEVIGLLQVVRKKYRRIVFVDNNFYTNPVYTKELMRQLKPLNLQWAASSSIDIAKDDEALRLARESGCILLLIGYEISGNSTEVQQGGKLVHAQRYLEYTRKIKSYGIKIKGHFIFGFPNDTLRTLLSMWWFCFRLQPNITSLGLLVPFPGSRFYQENLERGTLVNLNWRSYSMYELCFAHSHLNNRFMKFAYPFIHALFLITTSIGGFVLFVFFALSVYFVDIKGWRPF